KTDFGKMRKGEFEGDPQEGRAHASKHQAASRETANTPGESAGEYAHNRSDEKQNRPAADARKAAVNREHGGDPGHGSKNENERVDEAASKGDGQARVQNDDEEKADAKPRVDAEVKSGVGKRQRRAGDGGAEQAKSGGGSRPRVRWEKMSPGAQRHQCFTIALKPAPSRPFLAASADF